MTRRKQPEQDLPACPDRPEDAHKGTFGTVIVVAGSATMIGAPALCASAALRGGAGLVKVATDPAILPHVLTIEPSATGLKVDPWPGGLEAALTAADGEARAVLAVGPGLGQEAAAVELVQALLRGPRSIVLDADGLNALARTGKPRAGAKLPEAGRPGAGLPGAGVGVVLTPHPGEFRRLAEPLGIRESPTDPGERPAAAEALARAHQAVVVLKGRHTVITDGRRTRLNATGNPALATAGSGDVLTGLMAALIAQGMAPYEAAVLAVHLHGRAADRWAARHGRSGLTARDLASELPDAFEEYRRTGRSQ